MHIISFWFTDIPTHVDIAEYDDLFHCFDILVEYKNNKQTTENEIDFANKAYYYVFIKWNVGWFHRNVGLFNFKRFSMNF